MTILQFGTLPVPRTTAWSGENQFFVAPCRWANGALAVCQNEAPGVGKPTFTKPHSQRQRQAIAEALCDLCGQSLRNRIKVSLSHANIRTNGALGPAILQVEPMLHRSCAATSIRYCPSLRRDISAGTLRVWQVTQYRTQVAILRPETVAIYVPGHVPMPGQVVCGHGKIELLNWRLRDEEWLTR